MGLRECRHVRSGDSSAVCRPASIYGIAISLVVRDGDVHRIGRKVVVRCRQFDITVCRLNPPNDRPHGDAVLFDSGVINARAVRIEFDKLLNQCIRLFLDLCHIITLPPPDMYACIHHTTEKTA